MGAVHVRIHRLVVHHVVLIPESLGVLVREAERATNSLWEPIDVVVFNHGRDYFEELIFENQLCAVGVENSFVRFSAFNAKLKRWLVVPFKDQVTILGRTSRIYLSTGA
jgi:hypothetical protein